LEAELTGQALFLLLDGLGLDFLNNNRYKGLYFFLRAVFGEGTDLATVVALLSFLYVSGVAEEDPKDMELEENTHHNEDDEGRVVVVASTGQRAVEAPELLSHAPRAEDAEHETGKDTAKVYVSKRSADAVSALSAIFSHFNQYSVEEIFFLALVVKRHVDVVDQQNQPQAHRRQSQEPGVPSGTSPVAHDQESHQELDSHEATNDVDGPCATDFEE